MNDFQLQILENLAKRVRSCRLQRLADSLGVSKPYVTASIKGLREKGLVKCESEAVRCPGRPKHKYTITSKGRKLV